MPAAGHGAVRAAHQWAELDRRVRGPVQARGTRRAARLFAVPQPGKVSRRRDSRAGVRRGFG